MLKVKELMTPDVVTLSPDVTLRDAMEVLARRHVSGAPVLDHGRIVGVVSATDLLRLASSVPGVPTRRDEPLPLQDEWEPAADEDEGDPDEPTGAYFSELWEDAGATVSERLESIEGPEWNALDEHDVSEAMTTAAITVPPDSTVEGAAALMRDRGVHRVLVTEDSGRLVGVLSAIDVVRAAADGRFTKRTYVFNREP